MPKNRIVKFVDIGAYPGRARVDMMAKQVFIPSRPWPFKDVLALAAAIGADPICPHCKVKMVKAHIEMEMLQGEPTWLAVWLCDCKTKPDLPEES